MSFALVTGSLCFITFSKSLYPRRVANKTLALTINISSTGAKPLRLVSVQYNSSGQINGVSWYNSNTSTSTANSGNVYPGVYMGSTDGNILSGMAVNVLVYDGTGYIGLKTSYGYPYDDYSDSNND